MKFSSVTVKLNLTTTLQTEKLSAAKTGNVILTEVLSCNSAYPYLEERDGKLTTLAIGDRLVGALGARQALRGFVGYSPSLLSPDTPLSLLNMGGVIGCCTDAAVGLGEAIKLKYLGTVVDAEGVVNINRSALPHAVTIAVPRPIILILGTCMNAGKTLCASQIINAASQAGYRVGAAKIAGVAAIKDLQCFSNAGAIDVKSFLDCGLPSTVEIDDLAQVVKNIVNALQGELLIVELGDGIMGHYKVETVLKNKEIMAHVASIVVCATDIAAAYGAKKYLAKLCNKIDVFSGPATDNSAGSNYIREKFAIPAINAVKSPRELFSCLQSTWKNKHG